MADLVIDVVVRSRKGLVWEGKAKTVTGWNKKGPFDILPYHANFVCTLSKKLTIQKTDGSNEEINIETGMMQVYRDRVVVFLGVD